MTGTEHRTYHMQIRYSAIEIRPRLFFERQDVFIRITGLFPNFPEVNRQLMGVLDHSGESTAQKSSWVLWKVKPPNCLKLVWISMVVLFFFFFLCKPKGSFCMPDGSSTFGCRVIGSEAHLWVHRFLFNYMRGSLHHPAKVNTVQFEHSFLWLVYINMIKGWKINVHEAALYYQLIFSILSTSILTCKQFFKITGKILPYLR